MLPYIRIFNYILSSVFTVLQQHGAVNPTVLPYVHKKEKLNQQFDITTRKKYRGVNKEENHSMPSHFVLQILQH